jgi:hypothetical protein
MRVFGSVGQNEYHINLPGTGFKPTNAATEE